MSGSSRKQSRGLEHHDGIVGEAEIAGKTDDEAGRHVAAIRIVRIDRPHRRRQRGPIRDEADLVAASCRDSAAAAARCRGRSMMTASSARNISALAPRIALAAIDDGFEQAGHDQHVGITGRA